MPSDFPFFFEDTLQPSTTPYIIRYPDIMFKDQDLLTNINYTMVNHDKGKNKSASNDSSYKGSRQTKIPSPVGSSQDEYSHHSSSSDSSSDTPSEQPIFDTESESLQSVTNLLNHWHSDSQPESDVKPRKAQKTSIRDFPTCSPINNEQCFNADSAASSSYFAFKQFGKSNQSFGDSNERVNSNGVTSSPSSPSEQVSTTATRGSTRLTHLSRKNIKQPSLVNSYPSKDNGFELCILAQPEEQHRARYMTEGSRGSVKDKNNDGYPTVKLFGYNQPAVLQVFVGNDSGRVRPHGFYQACKVSGKNATSCKEKEIDGTTVIEINMLPENDMTISCDCVGILKLRNADVERRMKFVRGKKKSVHARLVFRVTLLKPDGSPLTLQCASTPILCTQPPGIPEICKKSLSACSVVGGQELFIIGKNFAKGSKVLFQLLSESGNIVWEACGDIDQEYFQQSHIVCKVPPYNSQLITKPVTVNLIVQSNDRNSDSHLFTYEPEIQVKNDGLVSSEHEKLPPNVNSSMDLTTQMNHSGSYTDLISDSSTTLGISTTAIMQTNPYLSGNILSNHNSNLSLDNSNTGMDNLPSLSISSLSTSNSPVSLTSPVDQPPLIPSNFAFSCLSPSIQSEPMQGVESLEKTVSSNQTVNLLDQSVLSDHQTSFSFDCLSSQPDLMVGITEEGIISNAVETKPLLSPPNTGFTFDLAETVPQGGSNENLVLPNNCDISSTTNETTSVLNALSSPFNFSCPLKQEPLEVMDMCREALIVQEKISLDDTISTSQQGLASNFSFNRPNETSEHTPMQGIQSLSSDISLNLLNLPETKLSDFEQSQSLTNLDLNDILNYVNEVLINGNQQ